MHCVTRKYVHYVCKSSAKQVSCRPITTHCCCTICRGRCGPATQSVCLYTAVLQQLQVSRPHTHTTAAQHTLLFSPTHWDEQLADCIQHQALLSHAGGIHIYPNTWVLSAMHTIVA